MEDWQLDFEWIQAQHKVKEAMKKENLPDLNQVLFLIGMQELGRWNKAFTKDEKRDLMHVAVCRLLAYEGYFEFEGRDQDGWPHYKQVREMGEITVENQEKMLKTLAIRYLNDETVI